MLPFPNIDPIALTIGPMSVRWYGLAYIAEILLGLACIRSTLAALLKGTRLTIWDFTFYLMLGIIVGGRLGYVLIYDPAFYFSHPFEIFKVWNGGMSFHGGALGCVIASWQFGREAKVSFMELLDLVAWGATPGIALGRVANFINGELWGRATPITIGMVFPGSGNLPRHPSQLYEAFFEGVLLFVLLSILRRFPLRRGQLFGAFLILYGVFRFGIEYFREPDVQMPLMFQGPHLITMGQILCVGMAAAGILLTTVKFYKSPSE